VVVEESISGRAYACCCACRYVTPFSSRSFFRVCVLVCLCACVLVCLCACVLVRVSSICRLATRHGKAPYCFPSGGSNSLGTWGYIEAVRELKAQLEASGEAVDRIYFACGSGGTAAGLALGVHWSGLGASGTELVGLGVDDTPTFFYDKLDQIFEGLGVPRSADGAPMSSRALLRLEQCIGAGYAQSTDAELAAIVQIARSTGIVLDPVYSGKAAIGLAADLKARPVKRALFIHTGGLLGLYAKEEQLAPLLAGGWSSFS
jgi:D-cysteine desulfhydrase